MADERDENFPNFDILSGFDVLLPHNKNSEKFGANSKKENLNTATEELKGRAKREDLPMWKPKSLTRSSKMHKPKKPSRQHSG